MTSCHAAFRAGAGWPRFRGDALSCGRRFVVPAVTPVAGHGGEGDRREPRPGRSGYRRDPRSASRSGPTARLPAPARSGLRPRQAGRARRGHPGPGSRSSPAAWAGRLHARRPRAAPGRGRTPARIVPQAELPADGQAQHVTVAAAAAVQVARAQQDPAAQDVHATIAASR